MNHFLLLKPLIHTQSSFSKNFLALNRTIVNFRLLLFFHETTVFVKK